MREHRFRPITLLLVLMMAGLIVAWLLPREAAAPKAVAVGEPRQARIAEDHLAKSPVVPAAAAPVPDAAPLVMPDIVTGGMHEMQAYRLAVRAGAVSLDAVERLTGDFRQRRGPPAWMPGMWCVRLLDANMRVLAEETAAAPDAVCLVLDPHNTTAAGVPQATQFSGAGEEAMLQVRLPPQPGAKWLKVYRLSGLERADWNTEPLGQVLASISLP